MRTTVFLTGATGTMGWAGLQELLAHKEENNYVIRILARPSETNKKKLAKYADEIEIIWGDLTNYDDILRGVTGSDIVLHVGGMVSPQADYKPRATRKVNITAAEYLRDAILAQEKQPKLVYIGSVAQMGDRREPLHWGRAGDPICVSAYDHYGLTKAMAERILTDSGIKTWVSLRQSGILYPAILKNYDPIMFHVPIRGVLEWATVEDSGRLLEHVCRADVPEEFWNRYYNIGSGADYRISNYEFECLLLDAIGCPRPEKIFNANWFTTRNFHGMWYLDGDKLEEYLHFRANVPIQTYFAQMAKSKQVPAMIRFAGATKIAKLFPRCVKIAMWAMANKAVHGTQTWIKKAPLPSPHGGKPTAGARSEYELRVAAYYGSLEKYNAIPDWKHSDLSHNSEEAVILNHGYDETKPMSEFTLEDMQKAAEFRGGKCLTTLESLEVQKFGGLEDTSSQPQNLWDIQLEWQCAEGHTFKASPRLVLLGGHWCPECFPYPYADVENPRPWAWDREAKRNPFFAQLWTPLHDANEDNVYDEHVFDGWE